MASKDKAHILYCSFCAKPHTEVAKLVAGPGAYICDACVKAAAEYMKKPVPAGGGFKGYGDLDTDVLLKVLKPAVATLDAMRDNIQARIDELRKREVSWAAIGDALGVSRQAAWERFS